MNPTDFTHAEPFAWAWRNKVTGAKGVYFEDPKPFGITSHPDYEWTNLYTEAQPIATLQAQPAEVSDADLYDTLEPAIVSRYVVERRVGGGFWGYCVKAGDGAQEIFVGHKNACEHVRQALQTACLDGAYMAHEKARAILALRPQVESESPTVEAAREMGAKGGPAVEAERLAFEAWMAGHCWKVSPTWNGQTYDDSEEDKKRKLLDPLARTTRMLWAAWRDRAALRPQAVPMTDEQAKQFLKQSDLLDMFLHIGWYSAPRKGFDQHALSLIRAVERFHRIGITAPAGQPKE